MGRVLAAVMPAPRARVEVREFAEPDLAPGSALLETIYSEVCGTDVHLWHGRLEGVPYPIIPGHVSVGRLVKARGAVRALDGSPFAEGDLVVFYDVHRACGRCYACTVARTPTRCPSRRVYGITDPASEGLLGGWSESIYLEPGVLAARLPAGVAPEDYIGGGCGLVTAVHMVERAAIRLGDTAVVQGVGAVGLATIALAKAHGAQKVVAIGAPDDRLALAARMGADVALDLRSTSPDERRARVHDFTAGRGADVAFEAAGSARAVEEGLDLVRDGGAYIVGGHYTDAGDSHVNFHRQVNRKHLDIRGCWGSEARHFARALDVLAGNASHLPWREIGARVYGLDQLNEALADAEAMRLPKALVRPRSPNP